LLIEVFRDKIDIVVTFILPTLKENLVLMSIMSLEAHAEGTGRHHAEISPYAITTWLFSSLI